MTDIQKSNIIKPGQQLEPSQNGYQAAELERIGGKKRENLVRSDFAEWLFPSERLHQKTSLQMIPPPVTLVDLQQIHMKIDRYSENYSVDGVERRWKIF